MSSRPTISVVIPHYNRIQVTALAIRSALSQSYAPLEVIVVDDGSAISLDREALGIDDPCLRIMRLDRNQGAAAARQAGVQAARGDMLAFLDSDDVWLPHKLEAQVAHLAGECSQDNLIAVVCGWISRPEYGEKVEMIVPRENRDAADFALGCWFSPGSTLMVRRDVFDIEGPYDPKLRRLEDYEWFLRFGLAGGRVVVAPTVVAVISIGQRARLKDVRHAADHVKKMITALNHPLVNWEFRKNTRAYLALEVAKAAQNEGSYVCMGIHFLYSLVLKPRMRVSLKDWWPVRRCLSDAER